MVTRRTARYVGYSSHSANYVGYSRRARHRAPLNSPFSLLLWSIICVVLGIGTVAMAVVGVVALAGGFTPTPVDPNFPKPDGYRFQSWRLTKTIALCVDRNGGPETDKPLLDLVQEAVGTWQYADGGHVPLVVDGLCPGRGVAHGDGENVVGWGPLTGAIGMANVRMDQSGDVTEADITLLRSTNPSTECLRSLLLHEVGHVLGAAHQSAGSSSVMTPASGCGTSLSWSDIAAVRYMYH